MNEASHNELTSCVGVNQGEIIATSIAYLITQVQGEEVIAALSARGHARRNRRYYFYGVNIAAPGSAENPNPPVVVAFLDTFPMGGLQAMPPTLRMIFLIAARNIAPMEIINIGPGHDGRDNRN